MSTMARTVADQFWSHDIRARAAEMLGSGSCRYCVTPCAYLLRVRRRQSRSPGTTHLSPDSPAPHGGTPEEPAMPESVAVTPPHRRAWWGDRGVRTKILTAVGAAAVVAAAVGVLGISALGTSAAPARTCTTGNIAASRPSRTCERAHDIRIAARNAVLTPATPTAEAARTPPSRSAQEFHAAADTYASRTPRREADTRRLRGRVLRPVRAASPDRARPARPAQGLRRLVGRQPGRRGPARDGRRTTLSKVLDDGGRGRRRGRRGRRRRLRAAHGRGRDVLLVGIAVGAADRIRRRPRHRPRRRAVQNVTEALAAAT